MRDATLKPGRLHEDVGMQPASKGRPLPDETPETDERSSAHADPIYSSLPCDDLEFREIVEEFIDRLHSRIELMEEKCREQDMDELARLAHWLKGSGGTAGFACLTEPAKALEDACRNSDSRGIRMNLNRICAIRDQIALPDYDANAEISS